MPPLQRFKGITFNTLENLFLVVNSDHARFGALVDRFRDVDPEVFHAYVDRIETLLESIKFCSCVIDVPPTPKTSAIHSSATNT